MRNTTTTSFASRLKPKSFKHTALQRKTVPQADFRRSFLWRNTTISIVEELRIAMMLFTTHLAKCSPDWKLARREMGTPHDKPFGTPPALTEVSARRKQDARQARGGTP
jgi:hypothetical protein